MGNSLCYEELDWVETFMNNLTVKAQLGTEPTRNFSSGSELVYLDFRATGDGMRNSAPLLTNLVNNGVRLLVYAGNAGLSSVVIKICAFLKLSGSQIAFAITSATSGGWKNSKAVSKKNSWLPDPFLGSLKTRKRLWVA